MDHREDADGTALFDHEGRRKYLVTAEAERLLDAAETSEPAIRLLVHVLHFTGCRISEALALTPQSLDLNAGFLIFRTLKRRKRVFRAVPIPHALARDLAAFAMARGSTERIFHCSRTTAWRRIKSLMADADIVGSQAMPKALRHRFCVHAIGCKVPESAVQRWAGHARRRTTQIYTHATGHEDRELAKRMWGE